MTRPRVSVITASYQARDALEKTLKNVQQQTYPGIEHIVIDGGSTDGTVALLAKHAMHLHYHCSAPDRGISHAFNKGIAQSRGDYLYFLGAGDVFWTSDAVEKMMEGVAAQEHPILCGRVVRLTETGTIQWIAPRRFRPGFHKRALLWKMALPHQGLFVRRDFFDRYGGFDETLTFAMDYEHLLRAYHTFPSVWCKDVCVAVWQGGGVGCGRTLEIYTEYDQIKRRHRVAPALMLAGIHAWNIGKYRLKRLLERLSSRRT